MANATFVYKEAPYQDGVQKLEADVYYSKKDANVAKPLGSLYFLTCS
jgi:hypothetical protein